MRTRALCVAAMLALAGCPSRGGCPVDTGASQCIAVHDMAAPDLSAAGCVGTPPFCPLYNGPSLCIGNVWWCEGPARDLALPSD